MMMGRRFIGDENNKIYTNNYYSLDPQLSWRPVGMVTMISYVLYWSTVLLWKARIM